MRRYHALLLLCTFSGLAAADPMISELRVDQPGPDRQEFFEIAGQPFDSLDGCSYVVIGDDERSGACGVVEEIVSLDGLRLDAQGLLCVAESASGISGSIARPLNFENNDNVTHLLVRDFQARLGEDLDRDDDGILDRRMWSQLLDAVALSEGIAPDCAGNERVYASAIVQPQGAFSAGHVYRCGDDWLVGDFEWPGSSTPGQPNGCVDLATTRR